MLLELKLENFEVFNEQVSLNLEADLRIKKLLSNVFESNQGNAVKTAAIYGPNNTGKTCLIHAIEALKGVLTNTPFQITSNFFTNSWRTHFEVTFLCNFNRYMYSFCYNTDEELFCSEKFLQVKIDEYKNESYEVIFYRDDINKKYDSKDHKLRDALRLAAKNSSVIYSLDSDEFDELKKAKNILRSFGDRLTIASMEKTDFTKTIQILKQNDDSSGKVVSLIKNADLDISDFMYDESMWSRASKKAKDDEELNRRLDRYRLISVHRNKQLPSLLYDSSGTQKIIAIAGYIIDALENGKILVVDELDSGIHFKLARAIVSLFNNPLNNVSQLIFATHDISMLDIKTLFRKDQIWFTDKDEDQTYLYPLTEFTAEKAGVRYGTDIYERYIRGDFGAVPNPSLINLLLNKEEDGNE